ncbi:tetratricopeptide repeat-containing sensor histidine kinase [Tenacibaculum sp. E3R01]|uniref:ATP-binding protein n=1 Tax=Tenacibaculum sp. E3R01 TaxID=2267227 RepID=UPI001F17FD6E|nr:tetratricopeptide repeat-containing sensor histidine kinase [Tenacibaculum sp. E3R01]
MFFASKQLDINLENKKINNYCYFFRGFSFKEKKNFKGAKYEFLRIPQSFELYKYTKLYLGQIALEENQFLKALIIFEELERNNWKTNVKGFKVSNIKHNIGLCYLHLKKFEKAEKYLKNSVILYEKNKDTIELVGAYGDLAGLYYEQYKDGLAIPFYIKAYNLSKFTNDFTSKQNTAKNMAVVEENRKNLTAALKYRKEYEKWKDSLNNQNRIWETAQLEKKHAVQQKQQEVNVLQIENRAKTAEISRILYTVISLVVLLSIIIYFFRKNIKSKKIIGEQNKRLNDLNATKDKLFSIVSHDLRSSVNTLKLSNKKLINNLKAQNINVVYELLQKNSAIVGSAYNLLDNLLNWALLQTKQSYFEIKEMHLFFAVEHLVYNYLPFIKEKELHFESTISKSAKVLADQESLKIILRNLLDNAIKFSEPNDKIKIYIETSKEGFLDIVVEDSGIGMSEKTVLQLQKDTIAISEKENKEIIGSGLGFQLCKSMIKKNNGRILVESELGKGTKMIVSLPKPFINE